MVLISGSSPQLAGNFGGSIALDMEMKEKSNAAGGAARSMYRKAGRRLAGLVKAEQFLASFISRKYHSMIYKPRKT